MPENFDFLQDDKYEVGSVRNFLVSARVNAERKEYSASFHAIFALALSVLIYLAVDGTAIGISALFTSLLVFIIPPLCVFTFLYAPPLSKLLPIILPLLLFGIRITLVDGGKDIYPSLISLFTYFLCILCGAVLTKCVISGYTKNVTFVLLTVCYALIVVCEIAYIFIAQTGSFSLSALSDSVKAVFDSAANETVKLTQTEQGLEQLKGIFYASDDASASQIAAEINKTFDYAYSVIKSFIPSILAVSCMIYSFITVGIFTRVAAFFKIDVFVCITDLKWSYRPSMLTAKIYDIVFIIYIVTMFIELPAAISATIINLFLIMTPLMFVSSVKCIYSVLCRKTGNGLAAGAIIAGILFFMFLLLGIVSFFLVASVGITFMRARDREEKIIIPIKIMNDLELCKSAFAEKDEQHTDGENTDSEN